jgi:putative hydrolase of the HAD superfamily
MQLKHGVDPMTITTLGFDADDTLWENEQFFRFTQERFQDMLRDYAEPEDLAARLFEAEKKNLAFYGFGIKGFTLSMIETAIEVTDGRAPGEIISAILAAGREMLHHPVILLPEVRETLELLVGTYKLLLITKGDLFDQERKLAQSGLGELFSAIEIVSDKTVDTYTTIFNRHGDGPARAVMTGNSLKSDVIPALHAGAYGVYVPHELTWGFEKAEAPTGHARFREVQSLAVFPTLLRDF